MDVNEDNRNDDGSTNTDEEEEVETSCGETESNIYFSWHFLTVNFTKCQFE